MDNRPSGPDGDGRLSPLQSNLRAVQAVAGAVESTLGPKGLNCMLIDAVGDVTITNDGSTILSRIDASHPAARLLVRAARAQEEAVGDGTTTTAILAAEIVARGASWAEKGVPVSMLLEGIRLGARQAVEFIRSESRSVRELADPRLRSAVVVAARGESSIAGAVLEAGAILGMERLLVPSCDLRESVVVQQGASTCAFRGIVIQKDRLNRQMPDGLEDVSCLVVADALEPESLQSEALATERGFSEYMGNLDRFSAALDRIVSSGVKVVIVGKGVHDMAEERLTLAGCLLFRRVGTADLSRVARHTGATPIKRAGLMSLPDLASVLGRAGSVTADERRGSFRVSDGAGAPAATILVGAGTREVADEARRIAEDACGTLQASLRDGLVPGGGATELAARSHIERIRQDHRGLAGYGLECVADALKRPLAQIVANAGYNSLEKVEMVIEAQQQQKSSALGFDCQVGAAADMEQVGVLDPTGVKVHAIRTAAEVAEAILKIGTIVRAKQAAAEGAPEADQA